MTLEKQALQWEARAQPTHEQDPIIREGMTAYAHEQASLRRLLSQTFAKLWNKPITEMGLYAFDDDGREEDEELIAMPLEDDNAAEPVLDIADIPDSDNDDLGLDTDSDDDL